MRKLMDKYSSSDTSQDHLPDYNNRDRIIIMLGEIHDILHEFPTLEGKITDLHESNTEFAQLMDQHDDLDRKIRDLEEHDQPTSDVRMEDLKKNRALLKDKIYDILRPLA